MDEIAVRYGGSVPLSVEEDDGLETTATLYVGKAGSTPRITKIASFVNGVADISLDPEDTEIPLDTYKYQVNVAYSDGRLLKFPDPSTCDDGELPDFTVKEALDETEVS